MPTPPSSSPSFSLLRRWGVAFNVVVAVLLLAVVVVMLNYLSARHSRRWFCSSGAVYSLSPQTRQLLATLSAQTNTVKVIVYFGREEPLYGAVKSMLSEYETHCSKLAIEYVDYTLQLGRAAVLKTHYKLPAEAKDLVIFDAGGKTRLVYERELYDLDLSQFVTTREARRSTFKGELCFTSALVSVTDSRQFKACLLRGHGEHDFESDDDQMGYAKFVRVLREKNVEVQPLSLLGTNDVPADCQLLVIAGPRTALQAQELERIERHLNQGGRLLALLSYQSRDVDTGLERILTGWGVDVGRNLVMDKKQSQSGQTEALATAEFGKHPIVNPLLGTRLSLLLPRSVSPRAGASQADAARVTELAFTSKDAVAVGSIRNGVGSIERHGPIPLAVAVEKGGIQGVSGDRGSTRLVVVGESLFLGNLAIDYDSNRDFANLAVSWLLDRPQLLGGIGPRPIREYRINMTASEMLAARWILLAGLPGAVLILGGLVWLRRRA